MFLLRKIALASLGLASSVLFATVVETPQGLRERSKLVEEVLGRKVIGYLQEYTNRNIAESAISADEEIVELGDQVYVFTPGEQIPEHAGQGAERLIPIHYFPSLIQNAPIIQVPDLPTKFSVGQEIVIDASSTFSTDGSDLKYAWQVNEPLMSPGFGQSVFADDDAALKLPILRFTPTKSGIYSVKLTVQSSASGEAADKSFEIPVGGKPVFIWSVNDKVFADSDAGVLAIPYLVLNDLNATVKIDNKLSWKDEAGVLKVGDHYYWRPVNLELLGLIMIPKFSEWPNLAGTANPTEVLLRNPEWGQYVFFIDTKVNSVRIARSPFMLEITGNPVPKKAVVRAQSPSAKRSWGLKAVHADEAWKITKGKSAVKVAVIDTGINYQHADLAPTLSWKSDNEFVGKNLIDTTIRPFDNNGHGSHCAGIVAATGSQDGVVGIAPEITILPYKALNGGGGGTILSLAKAVYQAVTDGADVISASWGMDAFGVGQEEMELLRKAILYADAHGVTFVVAAGNDGALMTGASDHQITLPAWYRTPNMIVVASTSLDDTLSSFSNYGALVDVAAPGHQIISDINANSQGVLTAKFSGTSMATPLVAGIVGLMKSVNKDLKPADISHILIESSRQVESMKGKLAANGIVDAEAAVLKAKAFVPAPTVPKT